MHIKCCIKPSITVHCDGNKTNLQLQYHSGPTKQVNILLTNDSDENMPIFEISVLHEQCEKFSQISKFIPGI